MSNDNIRISAPQSPVRSAVVWTVSALKLVNDAYISFPAALLPILVPRFALSLTAVGSLSAVLSISSMLTQPLFGYLMDRWRGSRVVVIGPVITIVTMVLLVYAPSYWMVVGLVVIGGLATAAFNPQAAVLARLNSGARPGVGLAMLASGGQLGRAAGPLFITVLVSTLALSAVPLVALAPVLLVALAFLAVPRTLDRHEDALSPAHSRSRRRGIYVGILCGLVAIRALTLATFGTFLPLHLANLGFSLPEIGLTLSVLQLSGAVGGLIGGFLAHRIGDRNVIAVSLALPIVPLLLATATNGGMLVAVVFIGGLVLLLSNAVNVSFAIELWPTRAALVSGIMIGVGWGIGGALAAGFGVVADYAGLTTALRIAAFAPLLGLPFAMALPPAAEQPESAGRHAGGRSRSLVAGSGSEWQLGDRVE